MDDDSFKKELLSRLDEILALLALSCGVPEACVEESQADTTTRRETGAEQTDMTAESRQYLMKDEMQENYNMAMLKWTERNP